MAAVVVDRDAKASRGRALHRARHPGIVQVLHPPPGHILWAPRHQGMLDRAQEVELRIGLVDDHRPAHAGPRCYVDLSQYHKPGYSRQTDRKNTRLNSSHKCET